jgi:hypothetical protein
MPMLLVVPRAITIEVAIDAIICTMNFNGFSLYFLSVSLISLSETLSSSSTIASRYQRKPSRKPLATSTNAA